MKKDLQRHLKNKKAQFYILTAIVLIAYSVLLLHSYSVTPEPSGVFKEAYDNFVFESSAVLNNVLFEQKDANEEYERFLNNFISYSKMKKLNVEVFSVLLTGDRIYFSNKMDNPVKVINLNQTIGPDANTYFLRTGLSSVVLEVRDDVFHENIYKFTISNQGTEAKAVLRIRRGDDRQIFVMD